MSPDGSGLVEYRRCRREDSSPRIIAARVRRQRLVLGASRATRWARITPAGVDHRVRHSDAGQPAARDRARTPTATSGSAMFAAGKIGRVTPAGRHHRVRPSRRPISGPRALAAGPDGNIWFSEFHASKIGRITLERRGHGVRSAAAELRARRHHGRRRRQHVVRRAERHASTAASSSGNQRRSRHDATARSTEFRHLRARAGSPIERRGRSRSQHLVHEGRSSRPRHAGRDRSRSFRCRPWRARVGLTAGSDRQPPGRIANRLWYADGNGNKIGYLALRMIVVHRVAIGNITAFQLACRAFVPILGTGASSCATRCFPSLAARVVACAPTESHRAPVASAQSADSRPIRTRRSTRSASCSGSNVNDRSSSRAGDRASSPQGMKDVVLGQRRRRLDAQTSTARASRCLCKSACRRVCRAPRSRRPTLRVAEQAHSRAQRSAPRRSSSFR